MLARTMVSERQTPATQTNRDDNKFANHDSRVCLAVFHLTKEFLEEPAMFIVCPTSIVLKRADLLLGALSRLNHFPELVFMVLNDGQKCRFHAWTNTTMLQNDPLGRELNHFIQEKPEILEEPLFLLEVEDELRS